METETSRDPGDSASLEAESHMSQAVPDILKGPTEVRPQVSWGPRQVARM